MKLLLATAVSVSVLLAQGRPAHQTVSAVRHWSLGEVTRIAIEVSGSFEFRTDRLHNPERVYFDILGSRPHFDSRRLYTEELQDRLVSRIRVAETAPGVTRVVLDLNESGEVSSSQLTNPNRLIIEVRGSSARPATPEPSPVTTAQTQVIRQDPPKLEPVPVPAKPPVKVPVKAGPEVLAPAQAPASAVIRQEPPKLETAQVPAKPPIPAPVRPEAEKVAAEPSKAQLAKNEAPVRPLVERVEAPEARPSVPAAPDEIAKAARPTSAGSTSLVRALGLKIARVVIDPGHGGHDQGTEGPRGLLEKDLVLDISKRLGKLIEERLGAEVVYTRTDDTFVPLEGRTALANENKADLFLSIHANSSPLAKTAGVETYYLSVKGSSKDAIDTAARENASSQKSVFELADIIQKITRFDKAQESRELARRIQASLYPFSARSVPGSKDRGVRTAPFVVLIGASMPSVLAEIGFLSNPREEALLKKPDYRQKLAESIFRGVSRYVSGLSHFQVAKAQD